MTASQSSDHPHRFDTFGPPGDDMTRPHDAIMTDSHDDALLALPASAHTLPPCQEKDDALMACQNDSTTASCITVVHHVVFLASQHGGVLSGEDREFGQPEGGRWENHPRHELGGTGR